MDNKQMERNIANAKLLLEKAMPSRDFELIDESYSRQTPPLFGLDLPTFMRLRAMPSLKKEISTIG